MRYEHRVADVPLTLRGRANPSSWFTERRPSRRRKGRRRSLAGKSAMAEAAMLEQCRLHPEGIPDQDLAQKISHIPVNDRAQAINSLLSSRKLQIYKDGDTIVYRMVMQRKR